MAGPTEQAFETASCESLTSKGGYSTVEVGNASGESHDFDPELALDAAEARVARQRTCPIGELIEPDGETRFLEYTSTMRWDVKLGEKAKYIEDSIVKTIAGFANSTYGGTLLVGVEDNGDIFGLEEDDATFSKRGEQGDHDLWGQHLTNLLDRLGKSAAALVDWDFYSLDGKDVCRISIDPSDHPVLETKGDDTYFWWRPPSAPTTSPTRPSATS